MTMAIVSIIFPVLMVYAAVCDVRSFTIPNRISLALLACWPLAALLTGMPVADALMTAGLAFVVLLGGIVLFAFRLLGGGDAKLIAVAVLWVGAENVVPFVVWTTLAGAVLAIVLIQYRRMPLPAAAATRPWAVGLYERHRDMPYGVAIAAAALKVWPATIFFTLG